MTGICSQGDHAMADDSVKTVSATFRTREAADVAVEHLVQQHGISRADIFVQSKTARNTAGTAPSGGDASSHVDGARSDAALRGEIEVSADVARNEVGRTEHALRQAGASSVRTR
jgi:hypothetical protein